MTCHLNETLWAITTYYNPAGYKRRRANFKVFRQHLDVPLLVVELAEPKKHELQDTDGEIVIRKTGNSAIWQKERLLNIATDALPPHVKYVAWLDCDIVFRKRNWALESMQYLERRGGLLQPFKKVGHLPRLDEADMLKLNVLEDTQPMYMQQSFARAYALGQFKYQNSLNSLTSPLQMEKGTEPESVNDTRPTPGFAWVALRNDLNKIPLYEFCVIGGGDSALAYAAIGKPTLHSRGMMSPKQAAHYFRWAEKACSCFGGNVGFLDGEIRHFWHGWLNDRNYIGRNKILVDHDFDPGQDIVLDQNGVWTWANLQSGLAEDLKSYFFQRKEDG